jgi:hypothetical protein
MPNRSADRIVGLCFLLLLIVEFVFIGALAYGLLRLLAGLGAA